MHRLEVEKIFKIPSTDSVTHSDFNIFKRRFADLLMIQNFIFADNLFAKYKANMEWSEGVTRYVEYQIALLASHKNTYNPSKTFGEIFPDFDYNGLSHRYQHSATVAPIRFVGEGVVGRIMLYYTGMGKALLLDRSMPGRKKLYFQQTLDEPLIGSENYMLCKP